MTVELESIPLGTPRFREVVTKNLDHARLLEKLGADSYVIKMHPTVLRSYYELLLSLEPVEDARRRERKEYWRGVRHAVLTVLYLVWAAAVVLHII